MYNRRSNFRIGTNDVAGVIGALLSWGLGYANGGVIPNWNLIYLVVGSINICWAIVIIVYLPDGPHRQDDHQVQTYCSYLAHLEEPN